MRIGGVREKIVAAKRSGIKRVILPKSNESDWFKLPEYLKEGIEVFFTESYSEIAKNLPIYLKFNKSLVFKDLIFQSIS